MLLGAETPVSAGALAEELGVSRQVIVADIALLRAGGQDILATPRGYLVARPQQGLQKIVACRHSAGQMKEELYLFADNGALVRNVIVEHPIYGQIEGQLQIRSRLEADRFAQSLESAGSVPLSLVTGGVHLHTLIVPSEESYQNICAGLKKLGIYYEDGEE